MTKRNSLCVMVLAMALVPIVGEDAWSMVRLATIKPDPAVQAKLRDIGKLVDQAGTDNGRENLMRAIFALDPQGTHQPELVRQLIWQHAHSDGDVAQAMTLFVVIDLIDVPRGAMVQAIAPLLGETRDKRLEQACIEVANMIERPDAERGFDFSRYQRHIEGRLRRMQDIEPGLVEHMFGRSPGQALHALTVAVYRDARRKPLLWARHVVDDALWKRQYGFVPPKQPDAAVTQELEKMADRDEWWGRLYAGEVIRQHPEFGTDALVKRLNGDPHPLVQKTANAIRLPKRN